MASASQRWRSRSRQPTVTFPPVVAQDYLPIHGYLPMHLWLPTVTFPPALTYDYLSIHDYLPICGYLRLPSHLRLPLQLGEVCGDGVGPGQEGTSVVEGVMEVAPTRDRRRAADRHRRRSTAVCGDGRDAFIYFLKLHHYRLRLPEIRTSAVKV